MSFKGPFRDVDDVYSVWPVTDFKGSKSLTVQADRDDADINKIIARFEKSGTLPPISRGEPFYGDVSEYAGLADSLIKIQEAERLFMSYPAHLRERFDNDKVKFIEFLDDPNNRDEAISLGLILKPVVPETPAPEPGPAPVTPV